MRKILCFIGVLVVLIVAGCSRLVDAYEVDVTINGRVVSDSVLLYVYEQNHNKLMLLNEGVASKAKKISLSGTINNPKAAFIQFKGDTVPYYFVLDTAPISIEITKTGYILKGSNDNNTYFKYLQKRQNVMNEKDAIWSRYLAMAKDSTLSDSVELDLKKRNDILSDSILKMTQHHIEGNNISSILVKSQFK